MSQVGSELANVNTRNLLPKTTELGLTTALAFGRDMLRGPLAYFERYGDTFETKLLGVPYVVTRDPNWIMEVLLKQHASVIKDSTTRALTMLLGNGLLVSEGELWKTRRRLIQPHFQPAQLGGLFSNMQRETSREIESWQSGQSINLNELMARISLRAALRALCGAEADRLPDCESSILACMNYFSGFLGTLIPLPTWVPTPTNLRFIRARRHLRSAVAAIVREAEKGTAEGTPLGNLLLARREGHITDEALQDEVITLLLAGHETSALTLTYTLGLLAQHPSEQDAIAEELAVSGVPSSMQDVQRASRLRSALTESLRLYPASWAVGREVIVPVEIQGQKLAPGTQLFLHQWAAHHDPRWFSEPNRFDPTRWTEAFTANLPKGAYAPFGAGPRVCIGQHFALAEIMVVLGTLLSRFRHIAVSEFPPPLQPSVTLRPRAPVLVRVQSRA
jgi:cytochrome P450